MSSKLKLFFIFLTLLSFISCKTENNMQEERPPLEDSLSTEHLEFSDKTSPIITLNGNTTIDLIVGDHYIDVGAIAIDAVDGDISSKILTTGEVDVSRVGTYSIRYSISDVAGNRAEVTRLIIVKKRFNSKVIDTVLQEQNLDEIHPHTLDKDESRYYSMIENEYMTFSVKNNLLKRCELRASRGEEWHLTEQDKKQIIGRVKISDINSEGTDEITWMQLHHKANGAKPFVRLVWRMSPQRDTETNIYYNNSLWVVIRKNENSGLGNTDWYYLGALPLADFFTSLITVFRGDVLHIEINNHSLDLEIPIYWKNLDENEQKFYFKAGIYFSGNKNNNREATIEYESLRIY